MEEIGTMEIEATKTKCFETEESQITNIMAGTSKIETLSTVSFEIDESQFTVTLTNQCIKAQTFIKNKWIKETEQNKEKCCLVSADNSKLQFEITQAQQELTSLLIAQDCIEKANVELETNLLLAKERKLKVTERVKNTEKKYEDFWLESKARFESMPFVQKLLKAKDELKNIKQEINDLEKEEKAIYKEIKIKTKTCREIDRKRIVEFAEFMVIEMPKSINFIKEKSAALNVIVEELNSLKPKTHESVTKPDNLKPDNDTVVRNSHLMPTLQLNYLNVDYLNASLDKVKDDNQFTKSPDRTYSVHSILVIDPSKRNKQKKPHAEEFFSPFFYKPTAKYEKNYYAKKKLINILDDIKIGNNEAQRIITEVNPGELQPVDTISVDNHQSIEKNYGILNIQNNMKIAEIEDIELTASGTEKTIMPPTQFLDMTPQSRVDSQKVSQKKHLEQDAEEFHQAQASTSKEQSTQEENKIKFDLPQNVETKAVDVSDIPENEGEIEANETFNNQLEVSDNRFANMKDMMMKINNLNLSPQFVYAKKIMTPLKLQKPEDAVVTSKFFPQEQNLIITEVEPEVQKVAIEEAPPMTATEVPATPLEIDNEPVKLTVNDCKKLLIDDVSNTKKQKVSDLTQDDKPIYGSLFAGSTLMTSDMLDESANTTRFEDDDFPSCIDTSLLLSPKADLPMPNIEAQEVLSQDVPNIFTGLRKTGFSFFGLPAKPKPDSNDQNKKASEFNFNFGGDEKKSRGGIFSMFK